MKINRLLVIILFFPGAASHAGSWECVTSSASWTPRGSFGCTVYDGEMWIIGAAEDDEIYASADGASWRQVRSTVPWTSGRRWHTAVAFDDFLWVLDYDVWRSTDGIDWDFNGYSGVDHEEQGFLGHSSMVFHDRMWMLGGLYWEEIYPGVKDENILVQMTSGIVACSKEGYEYDPWWPYGWENIYGERGGHAPWPPRWGHTSVEFDGKMWVLGGQVVRYGWVSRYLNDVWHSTDGQNWVQVTANAPWCPRYRHTSVVFDNKIWVIGGRLFDQNVFLANDIWSSSDGVHWERETDCAPWSRRANHGSVVFQDKIYVMGGNAYLQGTLRGLNDVWSYSLEGETEENPCSPELHSADSDRNFRISLSELLQVIQFYNAGGYHWLPTGDGPYGAGRQEEECTCPPHSSDYNPQDWVISLRELLRLIQFYNSGGYSLCAESEDGFCPGRQ